MARKRASRTRATSGVLNSLFKITFCTTGDEHVTVLKEKIGQEGSEKVKEKVFPLKNGQSIDILSFGVESC